MNVDQQPNYWRTQSFTMTWSRISSFHDCNLCTISLPHRLLRLIDKKYSEKSSIPKPKSLLITTLIYFFSLFSISSQLTFLISRSLVSFCCAGYNWLRLIRDSKWSAGESKSQLDVFDFNKTTTMSAAGAKRGRSHLKLPWIVW